jgi:hypothetical protein
MPQAIQRLSSGPIDIIGDVHGELDALNTLLARLGYNQFGCHPEGRTIVFLGDLVDRGPDSPGVVEKVSGLYFAQRAQCILGNHELRLLNLVNKPDNSWTSEAMANKAIRRGWRAPMRVAHTLQLRATLTFFYQLPLALVRDDLRLIHACWHPPSFEELPKLVGSWSSLFARYRRNANTTLKQGGWTRKRVNDLKSIYPLNAPPQPDLPPPIYSLDLSQYFVLEQNLNPLRVLTQGLYGDLETQTPFWSGFRWQMCERTRWWDTYEDELPVIFGHYWRPRGGVAHESQKSTIFDGIGPTEWLGPKKNCFCLDYAVGLRFQERLNHVTEFKGALGALRVPEEGSVEDWELVFDDGERHRLPSPQRSS